MLYLRLIQLLMNGKDSTLYHVASIQMHVAALLLLQTYQCFNLMPWLISMRLHLVQFFLSHSIAFSERAYKLANEPKEKYIAKDAEHIDLYDQVDKIPFDKFESFFKENFK